MLSRADKGVPRWLRVGLVIACAPVAVGAVVMAVVLLVSACAGDTVPLRGDGQLLQRAQQVIREGTDPVLFRTIAGGDWDRVHVFPGPPSAQVIEDEFGISLDVAEPYARYHRGGILIFVTGGFVTRAVLLEPYPFDGDGGSYGPTVTVRRAHQEAESLSFTDLSMMRATRCGTGSCITRLPAQWDSPPSDPGNFGGEPW